MKVYRVYESFHSDDESGTCEYGTYSTPEKAAARVKAVWEKNKYPSNYSTSALGSRTYSGMFAEDCIDLLVDEIEVDRDIVDVRKGWT